MNEKREFSQESRENRTSVGRALLFLLIGTVAVACSLVAEPVSCLLFGGVAAVFFCASLLRLAPKRSGYIFGFALLSFAVAVGVAYLFTLLPKGFTHGVFNYFIAILPLLIALPTGVCLLKSRTHNETMIFGGGTFFAGAAVSILLVLKYAFGHVGADTIKKLGEECLSVIEKNALLMRYEEAGITDLKKLFPFVYRFVVLLSPGIVAAIGLFGVYLCIFTARLLAGNTFKRAYPNRFAITYSRIAAILETASIVILIFSFYGMRANAFSAVVGNFALIFAPTSALIGVAHTLAGLRRPGFLSILLVILPAALLLISPVEAILYLAFVGASSSIFRFP